MLDNVFYKGTSSSRTLFELILRLRKVKLEENIRLHIIHVAGTRMIVSGVDALSRDETSKGVMEGKNIFYISFLSISQQHREILFFWRG